MNSDQVTAGKNIIPDLTGSTAQNIGVTSSGRYSAIEAAFSCRVLLDAREK